MALQQLNDCICEINGNLSSYLMKGFILEEEIKLV